MKNINGWHLPDDDTYFARFASSGERFQVAHLHAALSHVQDWSVAIDGGAHVGFWTTELAARFKKVMAFEPNPATFECLHANMRGLAGVKLYRSALMDVAGFVEPHADATRPGNSGSNFVQPSAGGIIPAVRIDDLGLTSLGLLKLDLEGAESLALEGAREAIATFRPVIIMETDKGEFARRFGREPGEATRQVLALGYREVAHMRPDRVFIPEI